MLWWIKDGCQFTDTPPLESGVTFTTYFSTEDKRSDVLGLLRLRPEKLVASALVFWNTCSWVILRPSYWREHLGRPKGEALRLHEKEMPSQPPAIPVPGFQVIPDETPDIAEKGDYPYLAPSYMVDSWAKKWLLFLATRFCGREIYNQSKCWQGNSGHIFWHYLYSSTPKVWTPALAHPDGCWCPFVAMPGFCLLAWSQL